MNHKWHATKFDSIVFLRGLNAKWSFIRLYFGEWPQAKCVALNSHLMTSRYPSTMHWIWIYEIQNTKLTGNEKKWNGFVFFPTDEFATLNWPTNNILMIGSHRIYLSCQAIYIASNDGFLAFIYKVRKKCVRVDTKNWMLLIINFWYASTRVCNINEITARKIERDGCGLCGWKRRRKECTEWSGVSEWVSEPSVWFHGNK